MTLTARPDVCIIGAGPAGALLGASLAALDHDVLILDAGKRFDLADDRRRMEQSLRTDPTTAIWEMGGDRDAFTVSGGAAYQLNERRVKAIGGSTLHWGATVPRMHPEDFEMASRHGLSDDWPISYGDLEPYYLAAEWEMGAAGAPSPFGGDRSGPYPHDPHPFSHSDHIFADAFERLGLELHSLPRAINPAPYDDRAECVGFGTCNPVCPSGAKYTAVAHVDKAEAAGATVLERARVRRLEHDRSGERIERAVVDHAGDAGAIEADVFVVAAGTIETPRLLLLSASRTHPDGFANSSGLVGRRFIEHVVVRARGRLERPTRQHLIGFGTAACEQYYGYRDGPRGSMLITPSNTAGQSPLDATMTAGSHLGQLSRGDVPGGSRWGDGLVDRIRAGSEGLIEISAGTDMLPDEDNVVRLDASKTDDLGDPVPDLDFAIDAHAIEVLGRIEGVLHEILEATGAEEIHSTHPPEAAFFANHQLGTTRMGTDPAASVVDRNLRAHDHDNLYLSGGSVFVTGGPANPTLTIAALTLRLADHLHEDLSD